MFKKLIVIVFILNMMSSLIYAAIVNVSGINYVSGSPRIVAMGGAYVAVADDANAVFLNPAGLGDQTSLDILANYGSLLADVNEKSIIGSIGLGEHGGIGFGYNVVGTYGLTFTDSSGNLRTGDVYDTDMAISYGYPIYEGLLLGAKAHQLSSRLLDNNGNGYGLSLGLLLKPSQALNVGLLIEDIYATDFIWQGSTAREKIPKNLVVGLAYYPIIDRLLLAVDLRGNSIERNSEIDAISIGGEFSLVEWLKFRIGTLFSRDDSANYVGARSAGLGINLLKNLQFDYAWQEQKNFRNDAHYFSLGGKF